MELFFATIQIVFGILSPFIVIGLIYAFISFMSYCKTLDEYRIEEKKKQPPFDSDAEFYEVPNPTMIGVVLKKDGEIVWRGGIDRKGIE